ncbi:hypothetical protein [Devosia sp. A449]
MKKFTLAAAIATVSVAAFSVAAIAEENLIHGHTELGLVAALTAQGVAVDGVEEWGEFVRVWSTTTSGANAMQLLDADTLRPVLR